MTERFELIDELGAGGMGTVWKARDIETGDVVALKLVHPHLARDPEYIPRFEREVEVARRIDSPYVVRVLGYGTREGVPYMAMEYVEGQSLRDLVRANGPMTWDQAKPIIRQIAEALGAAHEVGVIHRDVKPSNILITKDGTAKLADFGIARALDLTRLTGSSTMLGTPHYMAPEGTASPQSDLYALGCVVFEMLTGRPPFEGDSQQAVLLKHIGEPPETATVPAEARPLVGWLLAKSAAARPSSAPEFLGALDRGLPAAARAERQPRRWPAIVLGVVVIVLLLGAAAGMVRFGPEESSAGAPSELTSSVAEASPPATSGGGSGADTETRATVSPSPDAVVVPTVLVTPLSVATGSAVTAQAAVATGTRTLASARLTTIAFTERVGSDANCRGITGYRFFVPGLGALPALSDGTGRSTATSGVLVDGASPMDNGYGWHRGTDDYLTICVGQSPAAGSHTVTVFFGDDRVSTSFDHTRETVTTPVAPTATLAPSTTAAASNFRFYVRRAGVNDSVYNQATDCDRSRPASQFRPGPGEGLCLDWDLNAPRKVYQIRREIRLNGVLIETYSYSAEMYSGTWFNSTPNGASPGRYEWIWFYDGAPIGTGTVAVP